MIGLAFLAGVIIGAEAGFLLAVALASVRVHRAVGELDKLRAKIRRYLLEREDQLAEEG